MVVVAIPVADEEHRRRQGRSFHLDLVRVSAAAAGYFCSTLVLCTGKKTPGGAGTHTRHTDVPVSRKAQLLAVKHTTRTLSGPPSTRASIAMDGGVADTTWLYTGR
jgi:hypothetical protein